MSSHVEVIQPTGIFDGTQAPRFRQEVETAIADGADVILVDLQTVSFMDSSGLGALVVALKAVRASGGRLFLCSVNQQIKTLFELTSMDQVFVIMADRTEFEQQVMAN